MVRFVSWNDENREELKQRSKRKIVWTTGILPIKVVDFCPAMEAKERCSLVAHKSPRNKHGPSNRVAFTRQSCNQYIIYDRGFNWFSIWLFHNETYMAIVDQINETVMATPVWLYTEPTLGI